MTFFTMCSICQRIFGDVRHFRELAYLTLFNHPARLNARKVLRGRSQGSSDRGDHAMPVLFPENYSRYSRGAYGVSFLCVPL